MEYHGDINLRLQSGWVWIKSSSVPWVIFIHGPTAFFGHGTFWWYDVEIFWDLTNSMTMCFFWVSLTMGYRTKKVTSYKPPISMSYNPMKMSWRCTSLNHHEDHDGQRTKKSWAYRWPRNKGSFQSAKGLELDWLF